MYPHAEIHGGLVVWNRVAGIFRMCTKGGVKNEERTADEGLGVKDLDKQQKNLALPRGHWKMPKFSKKER